MTLVTAADREIVMAERGRTWKVETLGASISSAADYKVGFVTGDQEILVLTRDYSSTVAAIFASLHAVGFTGGTDARQLCLRLRHSGTPIMAIKEGVTATLGTIITSASIRASSSTGNANASLPGDLKPLILEANTSYVVSLRNDGGQTGDISLAFYFRTAERLYTFNEG